MSKFFDDLEAQLHAAAAARVAGRPGPSQRRILGLRRGVGLAPVLAAVLVPLVVAAVILTVNGSGNSGHLGPSGGHPGPPNSSDVVARLADKYFNEAWSRTDKRDPGCAPRGGILSASRGGVSVDRPSETLFSILGVLRRPGTAADRIPSWKGGVGLPGVLYIHYFRLARVESGVHYYVAVTRLPGSPATPGRCTGELRGAMERAIPRTLPQTERAQILHMGSGFLPRVRASRPYDGVFLIGGGGAGGAGAKQLERMGLVGSTGRTIYGVVPDGVASVQLPLRPLHGYPHLRLTATVVSNVFVAHAPRFDLPTGEVWLSPAGKAIHRVNLNQ